MVRTYRPERHQLLSPWEKAMQHADSEEGRPINTGKRVFADYRVTKSSMDNGTPRSLKLPPITEDPQQMILFLGEEVGKALARSKEKMKKMKKEFVLYDPDETSLMNKNSAFNILERYKVPDNENYQKKVLAFFVDQNEQNKINYKKMTEFFENSRKQYLERMEIVTQKDEENSEKTRYSDNYHGRYDSQTSNNQVRLKPRKAHEQAFRERRDVGLMLEIEKALKGNKKKDPEQVLDELEDALRRTCGNDDNLTDNGHVRSLVNKHDIPINTALLLKSIERLDPSNTGSIEWPKFIEFFRKAIGSSPRRDRSESTKSISSFQTTPQTLQEIIPDKPAWETRQPLSSIGNHNNQINGNSNRWDESNDRTPLDSSLSQPSPWNNHSSFEEPTHNNKQTPYENPFNEFNEPTNQYDYNPNLEEAQPKENFYNGNGFDNDYYGNNFFEQPYQQDTAPANDDFPEMADDLDAAFEKSVNELRSQKEDSNHKKSPIDLPPIEQQQAEEKPSSFQQHGERGNIYKMVAGALRDKAAHNNGRLHTNDVRKIMSYYNLLFDADFPMDQINGMLTRNSSNDEVDCEQVIKMFGKEIV